MQKQISACVYFVSRLFYVGYHSSDKLWIWAERLCKTCEHEFQDWFDFEDSTNVALFFLFVFLFFLFLPFFKLIKNRFFVGCVSSATNETQQK